MEMQKLEIKALREELQIQDNRMPEIERKMLSLEVEKEILVKAKAKIKSTIEGKEDVIIFEDHFAMQDVIVYAAHRVGKNQLEGK